MCKERVSGSDEESLSENLREHVIINQGDQPLISQIMEDMKRV